MSFVYLLFQNCDYEILSGCRRKEERWDTEAAGNVQTTRKCSVYLCYSLFSTEDDLTVDVCECVCACCRVETVDKATRRV